MNLSIVSSSNWHPLSESPSAKQGTNVFQMSSTYIAYAQVKFDERGRLNMKELGIGAPEDTFRVSSVLSLP